MATINTSSGTSFSEIRDAYNSSEGRDALNDTLLRSWTTLSPLSISYFRGAKFTDGSIVPTSGPISIGDIFKTQGGSGKTFSGSEIIYRTENVYAHTNWSAHSGKLTGATGRSTYDEISSSNKRISLRATQSSSYPYSSLLLSNSASSSSNPGFLVDGSNKINRCTVWFRKHMMANYNDVQYGIIKLDSGKTWTQMKSYIDDKHTTFKDRIAIHGLGFVTHAGSAPTSLYSTSITDPIKGSNYISACSALDLHNRLGQTGGTVTSAQNTGTIHASKFWPDCESAYNYNYYASQFNVLKSYLGIDVEYVETSLNATVTGGGSPNIVFDSDQDLSEIYDGLYVEGLTVTLPDNIYIDAFNISLRKVLLRAENKSIVTFATSVSSGTGKVKLSGYVLRFRYSDTYYIKDLQVGPAYIILPRTHVSNPNEIGSSWWLNTLQWSFFVGDTTSNAGNSFDIDIMNDAPIGKYYYINWGRSIAGVPGTFWGTSHQWVTASSTHGAAWEPSQSDGMQNWKNGTDVITTGQTYWNDSDQTVTDWNCVRGTLYHSPAPTGPCSIVGGVVSDVGDSEGNKDIYRSYLYTEGTDYQKLFIFRTEKLNFHNLVSSYSNKLYLKFYIHAFGSDIGNLYVYISHLDKCTESSAYKLAEYGPNTAIPWSGFTSSNSPWQEKIIDISRFSSRAIAATQGWYLYFVSCNATGQKSDLCIDQIQIVETGLFNKVYQFLDQTSAEGSGAGDEWAPSLTGDIGQSGEAHQWANGGDAVSPWRDPPHPNTPATKYWYGTIPMKGWNLSNDTTPSSNTGPSGPYLGNSGASDIGPHGTTTGYLYTEHTGSNPTSRDFVVRLPGINFYREMLDPFSNHITFNFYVHAFGDSLIDRDVRIYIDSEPQSDHSSATLLRSLGGEGQAAWIDFTSSSDDWKKITTYLKDSSGNKYCSYTHNKTWYIYIVSGGTGLSSGNTAQHDLAIDYLYFQETTSGPVSELYTFDSHVFTNAGATGWEGPTLTQCRTAYDTSSADPNPSNKWWDNTSYFNVNTQGVQEWKVPKTGNYTIIAEGGQGGNGYASVTTNPQGTGGFGTKISGIFPLTQNDIIYIVVGQKGHEYPNADSGSYSGTSHWHPGGGGGGTYVVKASPSSANNNGSDILVIAGGGGGGDSYNANDGGHAIIDTSGTNTGSNGEGGSSGTWGGGGAGFKSGADGDHNDHAYMGTYSKSYKDNSKGGKPTHYHRANGGFGGGGGAALRGGGGGGYSGGNVTGTWYTSSSSRAYGGGSYNGDTTSGLANSLNSTAAGTSGHGKVTIIYGTYALPGSPITDALYSFTSHTFTNCGKYGMHGPTLQECKNTYTPSWTDNTSYFNVGTGSSAGIQRWTVPKNGTYRIEAYGAEGGRGYSTNSATVFNNGGRGAYMKGEFTLTKSQVLWIAVGQRGGQYGTQTGDSTYAHRPGAGGGGTFVVDGALGLSAGTSAILVIAGGGGGGGQPWRSQYQFGTSGGHATTSTNASTTGSAGNAGDASNTTYALSYSGAGFLQNGYHSAHSNYNTYMGTSTPKKYSQGLVGGYPNTWFRAHGGFGGGGGSALIPGGGGGYSGGDTCCTWHPPPQPNNRGHGGGSKFGSGASNTSSFIIGNTGHGHGKVVITFLS